MLFVLKAWTGTGWFGWLAGCIIPATFTCFLFLRFARDCKVETRMVNGGRYSSVADRDSACLSMFTHFTRWAFLQICCLSQELVRDGDLGFSELLFICFERERLSAS